MKTQVPSSKRVAGGISALDVARPMDRPIRTPEQETIGAEIADICATRAEFWERIWRMASATWSPQSATVMPLDDASHVTRAQRASLARSITMSRLNHRMRAIADGAARRRPHHA